MFLLMKKQNVLILILFLTHLVAYSGNKIVYLVAPPRSLSTAFVRMMQARGDFSVFNEPSIWAYTSIYYSDYFKDCYKPDAPTTFSQSHQLLLDEVKNKHVFTKELIFSVKDYLMKEQSLIKNPQVYFLFLIRNPHHIIISEYKKAPVIFDNYSSIIGSKDMYEFYQFVQQHGAHSPLIICAENLYQQETAEQICAYLDIPFTDRMLHWEKLSENFSGEAWHDIKFKEKIEYWHGDVLNSTGFVKPTAYEVDNTGYPTFSEVRNTQHRQECFKAYEENLIYYNLMLKAASPNSR